MEDVCHSERCRHQPRAYRGPGESRNRCHSRGRSRGEVLREVGDSGVTFLPAMSHWGIFVMGVSVGGEEGTVGTEAT